MAIWRRERQKRARDDSTEPETDMKVVVDSGN